MRYAQKRQAVQSMASQLESLASLQLLFLGFLVSYRPLDYYFFAGFFWQPWQLLRRARAQLERS